MPVLHDEVFQTQTEENVSKVRKHVGGYICKKLNLKASKDNQSEWVSRKGEGRLLEPCQEVMDTIDKADMCFTQFNGKTFPTLKPITQLPKF